MVTRSDMDHFADPAVSENDIQPEDSRGDKPFPGEPSWIDIIEAGH